MKPITVDVKALSIAVRENRANHRRIFEEAMEGYRAAASRWLDDRLNEIKRGGPPGPLAFREPVPEDHTADYDRVLRMLEMHKASEMKIEEHEFAQYVMDDWGWKKSWQATVSNYTVA